jgi:hypothetical protein
MQHGRYGDGDEAYSHVRFQRYWSILLTSEKLSKGVPRQGTLPALDACESSQGAVKMKVTWMELIGVSVAILLLGSGVWANVEEGSLSQNRGAWVSHATK